MASFPEPHGGAGAKPAKQRSIQPNVTVTTKISDGRYTNRRPLVTKTGKTGTTGKKANLQKAKKIAPKIFLKAGESVRIFVKYAVQFDYSYSSFLRGPKKGIFQYSGDWHLLFPQLSQDWKFQMAEDIKSGLMPLVEKAIIQRESLHGDFKSWEVELTFSCQFSDIQIRNPDDVCMASDDQKVIYY